MIAGMTYYQIGWYFLLYSFGGWVVEVIFHAVKCGKVINRGFLCGPLCPVYGFGAISIFALIKSNVLANIGFTEQRLVEGKDLESMLMVFIFGIILATLVELIAGWLLDILFHTRWWDYSKEPFNFRGYICLRFSLIWGAAVVFIVRVIQPIVEAETRFQINGVVGWIFLGGSYVILIADFVVTVLIVTGMNKKLAELDTMQKQLRVVSDSLSDKIGTETIKVYGSMEKKKGEAEASKAELQAKIEAKKAELSSSHSIFGANRLLKAFPEMKNHDYQEILDSIYKKVSGSAPKKESGK